MLFLGTAAAKDFRYAFGNQRPPLPLLGVRHYMRFAGLAGQNSAFFLGCYRVVMEGLKCGF